MKYPILLLCVALVSCQRKDIGSRYELEEFSEGKTAYYLLEKGVDSPGGVFDGVLQQVAWKDREIAALVDRLASNDPDGWYILNLDTGRISGPVEESWVMGKFSPVSAERFYSSPSKFRQ